MNRITVTTSNIILIGDTVFDEYGNSTIYQPYSIQNNGQEYILTPFLETHIGQNIPEITIKYDHIFASFEAENNDILRGYLQKISGIDLGESKILV